MKVTTSLLREAQRRVSEDPKLVLWDVLHNLVEADHTRAQVVEVELTSAEGNDAILTNLMSGATDLEDKLVAIYEHVLGIKTGQAAQVSGDVLNIVLRATENSPYTTVQLDGKYYSVRGRGDRRKVRELTPANPKSTLAERKFKLTGKLDPDSIGVSQSYMTGDAMMLQVSFVYEALGKIEAITVLINVQNEAAQLGTILGKTENDGIDADGLIALFKETVAKNEDQLWSIGVTGYLAGATYTVEGVVVVKDANTFNSEPAKLRFEHDNQGIIADAVTLRPTRFNVQGENDKFAEFRSYMEQSARDAEKAATESAANNQVDHLENVAAIVAKMAGKIPASHFAAAVDGLVKIIKN